MKERKKVVVIGEPRFLKLQLRTREREKSVQNQDRKRTERGRK